MVSAELVFVSHPEYNQFSFSLPGEPVALSVAGAIDRMNDHLFQIAGSRLYIEGEVSEFAVSQGKWVRFTLQDLEGGALLKCFMTVYQLTVELQNGDKIRVYAAPKIYPRYGQFTLNVNAIEVLGEGALAQQRERLRKQLEAEGLFDVSRKRALPMYPERIGLIASRESAAYTDFLRILGDRWGGVEVALAHVHVQGERAVPEIVGALGYFQSLPLADRPDVLVLTRGGGGLEDLMAFNDEGVVRAVFASQIPIVVGIGHERDESLAEFAADVRASTPSNAAERVVPDRHAVLGQIAHTTQRMQDRYHEALQTRAYAVTTAVSRLTRVLQAMRFEVEQVLSTISHTGDMLLHAVARAQERVESMARYLRELDPQRVLQRGYAIVRHEGRVIADVARLGKGDVLQVQLANGQIESTVNDYASKEEHNV